MVVHVQRVLPVDQGGYYRFSHEHLPRQPRDRPPIKEPRPVRKRIASWTTEFPAIHLRFLRKGGCLG